MISWLQIEKKKSKNEINACKAFIEIFQLLTGKRYNPKECPDVPNSTSPDVDFIFLPQNTHNPLLAIEHTSVEAFEPQIKYVKKSYDLVKDVNASCSKFLPSDRYFFLVVPNTFVNSIDKRGKTTFVNDIVPWVIDQAKNLKRDGWVERQYKGFNLCLMCRGSHPDLNGSVFRIPARPDGLSELSEERLWVAFCHGLKKFPNYKNSDFETVLLLEDISGEQSCPDFDKGELWKGKKNPIDSVIDYIVVFVSNKEEMIVANIWKNKENWHADVPFEMRFQKRNRKWQSLA